MYLQSQRQCFFFCQVERKIYQKLKLYGIKSGIKSLGIRLIEFGFAFFGKHVVHSCNSSIMSEITHQFDDRACHNDVGTFWIAKRSSNLCAVNFDVSYVLSCIFRNFYSIANENSTTWSNSWKKFNQRRFSFIASSRSGVSGDGL